MKIIDAHTHIFENISGFGHRGELRGIGNGIARWANGDDIALIPPELGDKSFEAESLVSFLDNNGIEKAILLQGSYYGFQNEYVWETVRRWPHLFVASATLDPFCKSAAEIFENLLEEKKFTIFKFEISSGGGLMGYHQDFDIAGNVFSGIFERISDSHGTLVLDIGSPGMASFQPQAVAAVAKRHPNMKIVLCHLLAPRRNDGEELERSLNMLNFTNVCFDLSAMPFNVSPEQYPYPTAQKFLAIAKNIVGVNKLIWGSDIPGTLLHGSYDKQINYILESDLFTPDELERVFYNNAMDVYFREPFDDSLQTC